MFYNYRISIWNDDLTRKLSDVMSIYEENIAVADTAVKRLGVLPDGCKVVVSRYLNGEMIDGWYYTGTTDSVKGEPVGEIIDGEYCPKSENFIDSLSQEEILRVRELKSNMRMKLHDMVVIGCIEVFWEVRK